MKRTICIVSSCITLAVLMMVQTFAISRFDAYSYWANAQNQVSFIGNDIINYYNYSKSTGMTPPSSIQSEFYKNGYYSNNIALFNQHSGGTASFDLFGYEPIFTWEFDPLNKSFPSDSTLVPSQFYQWTDNGFVLNQDSYIYATNAKLTSSYVGTPVIVYTQTLTFDSIPVKGNYCTGSFGYEFYNTDQELKFSSASVFQFDGKYYFYPNGSDPSLASDNNLLTQYPHNYKDIRVGSSTKTEIFLNTQYTLETVIYNDSVSYFLNGVFVGNGLVVTPLENNNSNSSTIIYSVGSRMVITEFSCRRQIVPSTTVMVNLGRSVLIPAGDDMEFYVHMRNGSVTNVTTETTVDFDFSLVSQMTLVFNEQVGVVPIEFADDWLYVKLPSSDVDRTFSRCYFTFSTPYVNTTTGDQLRWDMEMSFSDLVFGDPDDIGLNPDIDLEQDKFRNEVIGGINDVKQEIHDGFDIINGTLEDVRQEIQDGFDMVEDALSRDDTFDDVTASPDADIENVVPESDALIQYEQIMADANQALLDADLLGAQSFWQDVFNSVLTIPMAGMMAVISSSLLILRALLGR